MTEEGSPGAPGPRRRPLHPPDPGRPARYREAPELGPRLLFFSGGNALRRLSRYLVRFTHNSLHLITPFDSGGSSAELRRTFHMPAVGDLRNRLMALADQTVRGNPEIYALFAFRFPTDEGPEALRARLDAMVRGSDPLVTAVPDPPRGIVLSHLAVFAGAMPEAFDLRGASVGNLVLTGGYLDRDRDLDAALDAFSELVAARGTVRPVTDRDLHLVADLRDGRRIVGQHRITGRTEPPLEIPVERLFLCAPGSEETAVRPRIDSGVADMIGRADLVCFPIGSFYSSLLATLLPRGVADSVARSRAPKIYVPNPDGTDPEEIGLDLPGKVGRLLACLEESATTEVSARDLVHTVLLDTRTGSMPDVLLDEVRSQGVDVVALPLVSARSAPLYDERLLAEALLSLT